MRERVPHTREWDGCDYVYLQADQDDPNHLYLVERWASRAHYERYRESMMSQPGMENLAQYLIGEMNILYLEDMGV